MLRKGLTNHLCSLFEPSWALCRSWQGSQRSPVASSSTPPPFSWMTTWQRLLPFLPCPPWVGLPGRTHPYRDLPLWMLLLLCCFAFAYSVCLPSSAKAQSLLQGAPGGYTQWWENWEFGTERTVMEMKRTWHGLLATLTWGPGGPAAPASPRGPTTPYNKIRAKNPLSLQHLTWRLRASL